MLHSFDGVRSRSSSTSTSSSSATFPSFEQLAPSRAPTTVGEEETVVRIPGIEKDIRLKVDAGPGCGGVAWPAGEVLARYLAYRHNIDPSYLANRKAIELGSGTGLVGIAAAMLEPSLEICVTDQAPMLDLMNCNVKLNLGDKRAHNIQVAELNWGEPLSACLPVEESSLILAADCVYFEPAFPLLVQTLCDLAPIGKSLEILFCYKRRRKADKKFFSMLKKHFANEPVLDDKPGEKERYGRESISIVRLKRIK